MVSMMAAAAAVVVVHDWKLVFGAAFVPRVAPATLGEGAGGGAPPSSLPSHFTEHDIYDQELGRLDWTT